MVREIMKDVFFLAQKSDPATKADLQVARDLLDTLKAHTDECVGMTKRFREIELEYQDQDMKKHVQKFTGWTAQIIQQECDHLEGIII